jgi:hypothetical protein
MTLEERKFICYSTTARQPTHVIERRARSALHCISVLLGGTRDQGALLNILTAALANDVSIQVCTHWVASPAPCVYMQLRLVVYAASSGAP